jgi:DNA-binding CsgD family transcriptional regulator
LLDEFSTAIDRVFAAATGSCRWQDALIAVEDLTGSAGAVIDLIPKSPMIQGKTLAGSFTEENCAEYARDYQAICPRIRYAVEHPGAGTQFDYLFMDEAGMDRDPVYAWFGKHGLRYYLGSSLVESPNYSAFVSLQRTRRQGHAAADDLRLFDLLKPHLARAASLADQLGSLHCYRRFSSAMLEALPQAVLALDANGILLFANEMARRLLSHSDGLSLDGGRLKAATSADQANLDSRISAGIAPLDGMSGWTRIARPSGKHPLAVFVAPLRIEDEQLTAANARVLVLVHDLSEHRCADVPMLVSLYGLTETEARLASALSGGHSVESAASLLRIQPTTARTHLKSVFRKTGTSRQQDLVRLLTSLSSVSPRS